MEIEKEKQLNRLFIWLYGKTPVYIPFSSVNQYGLNHYPTITRTREIVITGELSPCHSVLFESMLGQGTQTASGRAIIISRHVPFCILGIEYSSSVMDYREIFKAKGNSLRISQPKDSLVEFTARYNCLLPVDNTSVPDVTALKYQPPYMAPATLTIDDDQLPKTVDDALLFSYSNNLEGLNEVGPVDMHLSYEGAISDKYPASGLHKICVEYSNATDSRMKIEFPNFMVQKRTTNLTNSMFEGTPAVDNAMDAVTVTLQEGEYK